MPIDTSGRRAEYILDLLKLMEQPLSLPGDEHPDLEVFRKHEVGVWLFEAHDAQEGWDHLGYRMARSLYANYTGWKQAGKGMYSAHREASFDGVALALSRWLPYSFEREQERVNAVLDMPGLSIRLEYEATVRITADMLKERAIDLG